MSWFAPSTPPDLSLCQKLQCGILQSLSSDEVKSCIEAGFDLTERTSPISPACRQYYPTPCQVGPQRWFADWSDAWLDPGPLVQYDLPLLPAMPPQAVGLPQPEMDYSSVDAGGVPFAAGGAYDGGAYAIPDSTSATTPGGSAQSATVVTTPVSFTPADMALSQIDASGAPRYTMSPSGGAYAPDANAQYPYFSNPGYHRYPGPSRTPMTPIALSQPLPSITPLNSKNMSAAGYVNPEGVFQRHDETGCGSVEAWINEHKGLAIAGLAGIVFLATRRRR